MKSKNEVGYCVCQKEEHENFIYDQKPASLLVLW